MGLKKNGKSERKNVSILKCNKCGNGFVDSVVYGMLLTIYQKDKFNIRFEYL